MGTGQRIKKTQITALVDVHLREGGRAAGKQCPRERTRLELMQTGQCQRRAVAAGRGKAEVRLRDTEPFGEKVPAVTI